MSYLLNLLILVPIAAYFWVRRKYWDRVYRVVGVAFGAVVSPWALGLYSLFHLSPLGLVPGLIGAAVMFIHGTPGFDLAVHFELIPKGVVTGLGSELIIESINGLIWALVYGLIGWAIDAIRMRRAARPARETV